RFQTGMMTVMLGTVTCYQLTPRCTLCVTRRSKRRPFSNARRWVASRTDQGDRPVAVSKLRLHDLCPIESVAQKGRRPMPNRLKSGPPPPLFSRKRRCHSQVCESYHFADVPEGGRRTTGSGSKSWHVRVWCGK